MVLFLMKIRENIFIRMLMKPFIMCGRKFIGKKYRNSPDAVYIRGLHNKYMGKRCFIIGNGPSLMSEDLDKLKGEITFASNRIYDMFPYTDWRPTVYMCVDTNIINELQIHNNGLRLLTNSIVLCRNSRFVKKLNKQLDIHEIRMDGKYVIERNKLVVENISEDVSDHFSLTQSVTCSMFELAVYMGMNEIYLLGLDHSFGIEIDMEGKKVINKDVMPHFKEQKDHAVYSSNKEALTKSYENIKKCMDEHKIIVKNATRGGKLEVFERVDFDSLFPQITSQSKD